MNQCAFCGSDTTNPRFCGRSCAASYNNLHHPKRKASKYCSCGVAIRPSSDMCKSCRALTIDYTLEEVIYDKHHKSSAFALVRSRARSVLKQAHRNTCEHCGYDKHVEACHIKAISSFPLSTRLSIVNSLDNLKALCPNCHWEFDNL